MWPTSLAGRSQLPVAVECTGQRGLLSEVGLEEVPAQRELPEPAT